MGRAGEKSAASSYNPAWMAGECRGRKGVVTLLAATMVAALLAACGSSGAGTTAATSTAPEGSSRATGSNGHGEGNASPGQAGEGGSPGTGNGSGASTPGGPAETAGGAGPAEGGAGGSGGSGAGGRTHDLPHVSTPLRVAGGGSAQFRTPHGDNSVQDFGQEAGESELREAAEALHEFYVARENEEWPRACSLLASAAARQLEELASQGSGGSRSCAEVLGQMSAQVPAGVRRELTVVDAASLRREGDNGFLIYRGESEGQSRVYAINMTLEAGGWKVAGLGPLPLE